ncbi:hypothetical protein CTI12_AA570450 [Artemisia annua]|uniref:Uncharacterized protein n=1 Tax=Artemisia annua TaxID=35608 RepID=A0A2U1KMU3_ARTAN|nr:hypothetical protein CTI12_AA570450 [Artemisia annua]
MFKEVWIDAEKAYYVAKVDERVNKAVACANRAANAARVAAIKAIQTYMPHKTNYDGLPIPMVQNINHLSTNRWYEAFTQGLTPSRREIGHGTLAERAPEHVLPSEEELPYTTHDQSTITESNGSSSMTSVCGGCPALKGAGVPLRRPIAGIAMGLVVDTEKFGGDGTPLIMSDITGSEDASGDMDFKLSTLMDAGNDDGVTAFQMDIKVTALTLSMGYNHEYEMASNVEKRWYIERPALETVKQANHGYEQQGMSSGAILNNCRILFAVIKKDMETDAMVPSHDSLNRGALGTHVNFTSKKRLF